MNDVTLYTPPRSGFSKFANSISRHRWPVGVASAVAIIASVAAHGLFERSERNSLKTELTDTRAKLGNAATAITAKDALLAELQEKLAAADKQISELTKKASEADRYRDGWNEESGRTNALTANLTDAISGNATGRCPDIEGEGFKISCKPDNLTVKDERRLLGPHLLAKYLGNDFVYRRDNNPAPGTAESGIEFLAQNQIRVVFLTNGDEIKLTNGTSEPVGILYDGKTRQIFVSTGAFNGEDKTIISCAKGVRADSELCSTGAFDIAPTLAYAIDAIKRSGGLNGVYAFATAEGNVPAVLHDSNAPKTPGSQSAVFSNALTATYHPSSAPR